MMAFDLPPTYNPYPSPYGMATPPASPQGWPAQPFAQPQTLPLAQAQPLGNGTFWNRPSADAASALMLYTNMRHANEYSYSDGSSVLMQNDEMRHNLKQQRLMDRWLGSHMGDLSAMEGNNTAQQAQLRKKLSAGILAKLNDPKLSLKKAQAIITDLEALQRGELTSLPDALKPDEALLKAANHRLDTRLVDVFVNKEEPLQALQKQLASAPDDATRNSLQQQLNQQLKATYGSRQAPRTAGVAQYTWDADAQLAYAKQQRALAYQAATEAKITGDLKTKLAALDGDTLKQPLADAEKTLQTKQTAGYQQQQKAIAELADFETNPENQTQLQQHQTALKAREAEIARLRAEKLRLQKNLSAGYNIDATPIKEDFKANPKNIARGAEVRPQRVQLGQAHTQNLKTLGNSLNLEALTPDEQIAFNKITPQQRGQIVLQTQGLQSLVSDETTLNNALKSQQALNKNAVGQINHNHKLKVAEARKDFDAKATRQTLHAVNQELVKTAKAPLPMSSAVQQQAKLATLAGKNYLNPIERVLKVTRSGEAPLVRALQSIHAQQLVSKNPLARGFAHAGEGFERLMGNVIGKPFEMLSKANPALGKLAMGGLTNMGILFEGVRLGKNLMDGDYKHAAYNAVGTAGGFGALWLTLPNLVTAAAGGAGVAAGITGVGLLGSMVIPGLVAFGGALLLRKLAEPLIEASGLTNREERDEQKLTDLANKYGHVTLSQQLLAQKAAEGQTLSPTEQGQLQQAQALMMPPVQGQAPSPFTLPMGQGAMPTGF